MTATAEHVYSFTVDDGRPSELTLLVDGLEREHDIRDMAMIEWRGDKWLAYTEHKWGWYLRVLKVAPGCVYSAPKPEAG